MYRPIKKYTTDTRQYIRDGFTPKCKGTGRMVSLRLSHESFLMMCQTCKQERLTAHPELIKYQGRKSSSSTPTITSNESGL